MTMCHEIEPLLTDYLHGELPEQQATAIATHLTGCMECRRNLTALRSAYAALHGLARDASLDSAALVELARTRLAARRPAPGLPRWIWQPALALAGLLLVLVLFRHGPGLCGCGPRIEKPPPIGRAGNTRRRADLRWVSNACWN